MTTLYVRCDRKGCWRVVDETNASPLSEHWSATEAERAAWRHLSNLGVGHVLMFDRYGRTRPARRPATVA
jgi:hypothetical protein